MISDTTSRKSHQSVKPEVCNRHPNALGMELSAVDSNSFSKPERREHVALFIPSLSGGGAQRVAVTLAREFTNRGLTVDLILARKSGPFVAQVPDYVRVVDLGASRTLTSVLPLCRYLRDSRPGAMMSIMNYANIVALWAKRLAGGGTRLVVSERNTLSAEIDKGSLFERRVMPYLVRRCYPWADAVIAVSKGAAKDLVDVGRLPQELVRAVYNPVVRPELISLSHEEVKHPWFTSKGPPIVLASGRLSYQKNFELLIRSFAEVSKTRAARLVILGEGKLRQGLESLIHELGLDDSVSLPGFVENPYCYMARAKAFVLSSRFEGLPGVLIEAMRIGTPVIASDCPSGPREILDHGRYGALVPVGDKAALIAAIHSALDGKIAPPPPASWQPFTIDAAVDEHLHVLLGRLPCKN